MKALLFLFAIHLLAYSVADAQELALAAEDSPAAGAGATTVSASDGSSSASMPVLGARDHSKSEISGSSTGKIDECKDLLAQMESDYKEMESRYWSLNSGLQESQENYHSNFNQMTEALFQMTEAREIETQKISESRNSLREALRRFNQNQNSETSKQLQDHYLELTVRLYSVLMDSQKTLESLKGQVSKIESSRSLFQNTQKELEELDHQKLALESKLVSLKIKCQPARRY